MKGIVAGLLLAGASVWLLGSAEAASCSGWRATCLKRGGGSSCDEKYAQCMVTGTWTEGAKWGGGTHSGVTKK